MQHPAAHTSIWVALVMIVFVPLSVRQYARATPK
jgi:ABC-2 type transport system permease protein